MSPERAEFDADDPAQVALWDELPLWSALAGALLLEHVPLRAARALDLGSGTGFPLLELAERLGPAARVVGVDPWRAAHARADAKRRAWPVPQAHLVRADGARLPFPAGAFELVVSNLGVNNFADPEAALAECRRVLAPGGVLALATNLQAHFLELYAVFDRVLEERGDVDARGRLAVHVAHRPTLKQLVALVTRADFRASGVYERDAVMRFRDGAALLSHHFIALGFLPAWREVAGDAATLAALREALDRAAAAAGELRLTVPLAAIVATAG